MKKFNKVLAILLALITVLTALPLSVIADSWMDVETKPLPGGDGSKVTVTVDAKALADLLRTEGLSKDTLFTILEDATINQDELLVAFTPEELFQIVPREKILELFDLRELIEKIGLAKLSTFIDLPALLAGCDKAELAALLRDVPELYKYADIERLIKDGYIDNQVILDNIKQEELKKAVADVDPDSVIPAILDLPTFADIQKVIRVYDMVLTDGIITPTDVMDVAAVESLAKTLFNDPAFNIGDYIDCVYADAAKAYFKDKYGNSNLNDVDNLKALRDMIRDGYLEVDFVYHVDDIDLLALIDHGFVDLGEVEADVHDYVESVFEAMDTTTLQSYHDMGMFDYTYNPITDTVTVTNVDIHMVLEMNIITVAELRANCPALEAHMEQHIDEWTHDDVMFDKMIEMIENNYIDIVIESYSFENIHYSDLVKDGYVSASEMIAHDLVDVNKLAMRLIDENKIQITEDLIDNAKLKAKIEATDPAVLVGYINASELIDTFGTQQIIDWLGGVEKTMACIDIPGVTNDILNLLPDIMNKLAANGVALTDVFYLDDLLSVLDFAKVIDLIGIDNIMDQLDNDELNELLKLIDLKSHLQQILMLFYNYGMKNIDKIVLNGFTVAEQDYTDLLKIDATQMMRALESVIPTLEDLAALDSNVLTTLDLQMEYLPEGEYDTVSKHIVFEFALAGGAEQIQKAAAALQKVISKFANELTVSLDGVVIDLVIPNQFASGYLELLNSDKISDEVKQKIMTVADMNGNEMIAFINDELTLDDICEILSAIEPSAVFEKVKNSAFVEAILAKLGKTAPDVTLDEVWDALGTKSITVENICEAIEKATGRDVMAILKAAAPKVDGFVDKAEEIAQIKSLLAKVESKLGINLTDDAAEEILNRGADEDLLDKIAAVVAAKVGKDIREVMANNSPDELWDKAIAKAAEREDIYKKVRNYLILGLEKLPDRLMTLSIADFYVANGVFAGDKTLNLDAVGMLEKLVDKLVDRVNNPKINKAVELLMSRLTGDVLPIDVSVKLDVENLNRVTFMDHTRTEVLFSAFLPAGTDLNIYKHNPDLTGYDFNGWEDENGYAVPTMPDQDITVYATMDAIELTFADANGNVLGSFYMSKGATFNLEKYAKLLAELNANVLLNHAPAISADDAKVFGSWRVLWTYGEGNTIDLDKQIGLDASFYEDTTLVVDWAKNYLLYFLDPAVDYTVTYNNGLYTVTVHDEFGTAYCLNVKDVLTKAETDDTVALELVIEKENIVLASIKNATLKSLNTATAANNQVWLDYKATDVVPESFLGTFYAGADIPAYSFSFTVSDTADGANMSAVTADFGGETIHIQLPYANTANTAEYMTRVYTAADAKREYVTTTVVRAGVIEFAAKHFSDFVISNEYLLTLEFNPVITGTLIGDYADENGDLYFPAGAEFSLRFELETGYVSGTIVDKNGNHYITGDSFTMPAASEHLTINVVPVQENVILTFTDANGNVIATAVMPKGYSFNVDDTLAQINEQALLNFAPAMSEEEKMVFTSWTVSWTYGAGNKLDLNQGIGLDVIFNEDTTFVAEWARSYRMFFLDPSVNYTVTYADGLYTVIVHDDFADVYCLNIKDILGKAAADSKVRLNLVIEQENIVLLDVQNATLKSLNDATAADNHVWFGFVKETVASDSFAGTFYENAALDSYTFGFVTSETADGANMSEVSADFGGETVKIQLPADTANTTEYMTRVYTAENGVRKYITTTVVRNGVIEFAVDSFSDYVVSNEYLLTVSTIPTSIQATLLGNYADQNGALYFPAGAAFKLNFSLNNSNYEITNIKDSEGGNYANGQMFTMPAAAVTLTVYASRSEVTLTFKDAQGNIVGSIKMPKGTSFSNATYAALLRSMNSGLLQNSPAISGDDAKLFGSWRVVWTTDSGMKIDLDKALGLYSTFTRDTTLTMSWGKNYFLFFLNPNVNYSVSYNEGLYTVTVHDSYFSNDYCLNIKDVLLKSATDDTVALKLVYEKDNIALADIKNATLKSVNTATAADNQAWFRYTKNAATTNAFAGTFYEGADLPCYSFSFIASSTVDATSFKAVAADFGGETIKIQIPFADTQNTAEYMTRVYTVTNGTREYVATTVVRDGLIEIAAEHFSDFVISNEYLLSLELMPVIDLTLIGNYADQNGDLYFPEGAQFELNFEVETDYVVDKIIDNNGNEYAPGDLFTMPAGAVKLTVYAHSTDSNLFYVFYYYFDHATGTLKQAADAYAYYPEAFDINLALNPKNVLPEALNAVLAGYDRNTYSWSALNQDQVGVSDISLFMVRNPISYTVDFVDAKDGSVISTLDGLTVENADTLYQLPAIPEGKIGNWTVLWIDAPADLYDATQNKITVVLSGKFEAVKHEIVHGAYVTDETPTSAEVGETVTVKVEDRYGYLAEITVTNAAGEVIEVVNGAFEMPNSAVTISVTYKPASFSYEINNAPGVGNYMDSIQVVITLQKGETLASISEECTLVSTEKNGDVTVLTYTFVLDGEKSISYKIERSKSLIARIFEGKIFNDGFYPNLDGTGVDFEKWSTPLFDALSFAVVSVAAEECSCTWLWIVLIVVLALILLFTILYVLGLKGIKIILLTYVATVVVEAFFSLCMLIARPFSKKNEEETEEETEEESEGSEE